MKRLIWLFLGCCLCLAVGCGVSSETVIPTDELTEEQKAEILAEDERIQDEESGLE